MTENTSLGKNTHVDESQTSLFWQQPFYWRTATVNKHSPTGWRELPHADLQKSDAVDLDKQCGITWGGVLLYLVSSTPDVMSFHGALKQV